MEEGLALTTEAYSDFYALVERIAVRRRWIWTKQTFRSIPCRQGSHTAAANRLYFDGWGHHNAFSGDYGASAMEPRLAGMADIDRDLKACDGCALTLSANI